MKLYQAIERIFLYRLSESDNISSYISKISRMGKFDEPKKVSVFSLLLERLGELEKRVEVLESDRRINVKVSGGSGGGPIGLQLTPGVHCPECSFIAKTEFGLKGHMKKHK